MGIKKFVTGITLSALFLPFAWSQEANGIPSSCAGCHNVSGPAANSVEGLIARKGPDLFYAGVKYQREWLEQWLQKPKAIRPAGMYFAKHVKHTDGKDVVDNASLVTHPSLDAKQAKSVASELMKLKANEQMIKAGEYQTGSISIQMGEMMFDKFRGCIACHEVEPGFGGASGPEVYTAAKRMQPDFMISYMRDPQGWTPHTFMPSKRLSDADLQKLVHYFRALATEVKP